MNVQIEIEYSLDQTLLNEIEHFNNYSLVPKINITSVYLEVFHRHLIEDWKPLFIKVYNASENKIIGIVPLMYHSIKRKNFVPYRIIRFFASTFSDFQDIYAKEEHKKLVVDEALKWLLEKFRWQEMILDDLLDSSNLNKHLEQYLSQNNLNYSHQKGKYFYIDLHRSWDEIKKGTSKSFVWKNIRLAKNRISNAGSWDIEYSPTLNEEEILERIIPIHIKRQEVLGRESDFKKQKYVSAYKSIIANALKEDEFKTFWLKFEGKYIGYMIGFYSEETFYWWNTAFLDEFKAFYPSRLLQYYVLEYMHQNGYKEFNFMRGESGYKDKWTKTTRTNHRFRIYNNKNLYGKLMGLFDKNFR